MAVVVTRVTGEKQAERLTKLYAQAEREISARLQRAIARRGSNSYTARQLQRQQAEVRAIIEELRKTSPAYINKFVKAAYGGGVKIAEEQLTQAGIAIIGKMGGINAKVMAVYSSQITSRLSEVLTTAGNRTEDIYNILRKDSALTGVLSGYESITQAEKRLLENAADGDVIGFVDKAGRQWSMERYTEMLTRTATMEMHNEAKRTEFLAHGEDLVVVSSHGGSCDLCSPFDGKVLSLTGATEGYTTLADARASGLFHPNCRHTYSLYISDNPDEGWIEAEEYHTKNTTAVQAATGEKTQTDNAEAKADKNTFAQKVEVAFPELKEDERKFIAETFKDVPEECQNLVLKYKPSGFDFHSDKVEFRPIYNIIATQKDDAYGRLHEYGHCIDFNAVPNNVVGYYSSKPTMWKAIQEDCTAFDLKTKEGKAFYATMVSETLNKNSPMRKYSPVSSIFDAMTKGDIHGGYGHSDDYYTKTPWNAPTEVFAELFTLTCQKNNEGLEYVEWFFPETFKAFRAFVDREGL